MTSTSQAAEPVHNGAFIDVTGLLLGLGQAVVDVGGCAGGGAEVALARGFGAAADWRAANARSADAARASAVARAASLSSNASASVSAVITSSRSSPTAPCSDCSASNRSLTCSARLASRVSSPGAQPISNWRLLSAMRCDEAGRVDDWPVISRSLAQDIAQAIECPGDAIRRLCLRFSLAGQVGFETCDARHQRLTFGKEMGDLLVSAQGVKLCRGFGRAWARGDLGCHCLPRCRRLSRHWASWAPLLGTRAPANPRR
jgi:hypothetical protein